MSINRQIYQLKQQSMDQMVVTIEYLPNVKTSIDGNQTKLSVVCHLKSGHFIGTNDLLLQLILAFKGPDVNDWRLLDRTNYHLVFNQVETMSLNNSRCLISGDSVCGDQIPDPDAVELTVEITTDYDLSIN